MDLTIIAFILGALSQFIVWLGAVQIRNRISSPYQLRTIIIFDVLVILIALIILGFLNLFLT